MEFIRANADEVRRCAALKGEPAPVDEILELDRRWREATTQAESTRAEQNALGHPLADELRALRPSVGFADCFRQNQLSFG